MKQQTFEEYLQDVHAETYTGTDDDMPDKFDSWISELDTAEIMLYGQRYGHAQWTVGFDRASKIALDAITYKPNL